MRKLFYMLTAILSFYSSIQAQNCFPEKDNNKIKIKYAIQPKAYAFNPKDVRIKSSIFLQAQQADETYLLSLSPDRFLNRFMKNAGLPPKNSAYGGWVPWCTVHKVMAGIEDAYLYCDNKEALTIAVKLGDWIDGQKIATQLLTGGKPNELLMSIIPYQQHCFKTKKR